MGIQGTLCVNGILTSHKTSLQKWRFDFLGPKDPQGPEPMEGLEPV